ncbi:DUF6283 family protein [Microbacterium enclense]|uniref:DUF6283 family protein n=1 Tax=Microbacterium enclense TaxID=993073 RepID=UPI003F7EB706
MPEPSLPRKTPCASCPYRRSVPSGVWHPDEYAKLPAYDGDIAEQQSIAVFSCHQGDGDVCAGWLGHRDPVDLLAVRVGIVDGRLDPSCAEYTTDVPLFDSGAEAAAHGTGDTLHPTGRAGAAIRKIVAVRAAAGDPVRLD